MKCRYLIVLTVVFAAISGCKKSAPPSLQKTDTTSNNTGTKITTPTGPVVFVSGTVTAANSYSVATLWRNGKAIALADSSINSNATGIAIIDTDVYVVGTVNAVATIWKNGVASQLSGGIIANGITTSGNDVYVIGDSYINGIYVATVWKNGTPSYLTDANTEAYPCGITVSGGNVYVAGNITAAGNFNTLTLWKNGTPRTIATNCTSSYGSYIWGTVQVGVVDTSVYITGAVENSSDTQLIATIWHDGSPAAYTDGTTSAAINAIAVSNGTVYTAGYINGSAVYWSGESEHILSPYINEQYTATSIIISNSIVYAAGYSGYSTTGAVYWHGGSLVALPGRNSVATGIAVVQH